MNIPDFIALLEAHDWYYDRSDDSRVYARGSASQKRLLFLCQQQPELFRLYNHASACVIRGEPFNFQSVTGDPVKDENHKHQTTHPMNTLEAALAAIFNPLIEALDRNTAAHSRDCSINLARTIEAPEGTGKSVIAEVAAAVGAEELPKKTRAKKTEAAPAPEPEAEAVPAPTPAPAAAPTPAPAATAGGVSEGRLRLTVQTLTPDNKKKLKAYFVKKHNVQGMSELNDAQRVDVHRAAVKIGAIDTFPEGEEAPAPAEDEIDIDNM